MTPFRLFCLVCALSILYVSCDTTDNSLPPDPVPPREETVAPKKKVKASPARQIVKTSPSLSIEARLEKCREYVEQKGFSTEYCFLVDMGIKSGKNRFFVYNLETNTVSLAGLVGHGSCNTQYLSQARFSNAPDCGCSSKGKYRVGSSYMGQWGKSYRLYGLDNSNSNAFKRGIVIHGHECIPDEEIYPRVLCNSFGCPMVSESFFEKLSDIIEGSDKPILLWIF